MTRRPPPITPWEWVSIGFCLGCFLLTLYCLLRIYLATT